MAFWDFKMYSICFTNVIEILILFCFFMMLKNEKVGMYKCFQQCADNPKVITLYLDGKNRNGIGLEPKVKILRHY